MTRAGDCFVQFCDKLQNVPAEILCVLLYIAQAVSLDTFLVVSLSNAHFAWIGPDVFNLALLMASIITSHRSLYRHNGRESSDINFAWAPWLFINAVLATKTIFIYHEIASDLKEEDPSFFGPNTLKLSLCLASCIFGLLLTSQHDAPLGSERRFYIQELTGTVVFDLLDTVDILEILFDGKTTDLFWDGLHEFILAVATLNLLIPTLPLLVLSQTKFGHRKLQRHLVYAHRMLVVLLINVPNLLVRFIVWHGFSGSISPFSIKNIILISMTFYEFYLHKKEKYKQHETERMKDENQKGFSFEVPKPISKETNNDNTENIDDNIIPESFRIESRIQTYL